MVLVNTLVLPIVEWKDVYFVQVLVKEIPDKQNVHEKHKEEGEEETVILMKSNEKRKQKKEIKKIKKIQKDFVEHC